MSNDSWKKCTHKLYRGGNIFDDYNDRLLSSYDEDLVEVSVPFVLYVHGVDGRKYPIKIKTADSV